MVTYEKSEWIVVNNFKFVIFFRTATVSIGMAACCRQVTVIRNGLPIPEIDFLIVTYENQTGFVVRFSKLFSKTKIIYVVY